MMHLELMQRVIQKDVRREDDADDGEMKEMERYFGLESMASRPFAIFPIQLLLDAFL